MFSRIKKEIADGNSLQVIPELNTELKNQPDNPELLYLLGQCYLQNDRGKRALKYAQKAYELDQNNVEYAVLLAKVSINLDRKTEAEFYAKAAIESNHNNEAYLLLAELEMSKNHGEEALLYVEKVLKQDAGSFQAHRLLIKIYIQQSRPLEVMMNAIEEAERYGHDEELEYDRMYSYFLHGEYETCQTIYKKIRQLWPNAAITQKAGELIQQIHYKKVQEEELKQKQIPLEEALSKLHKLIGLREVKEEIDRIVKFVQYEQQREQLLGIVSQNSPSYHFSFMGNPGTGKTTVARLLSEIFYHLGIIKENKVIEVDRSDLVGEYIGHTGPKTKKVIQEAMGGVLFIDEAYALAPDTNGGSDFGAEAIEVILKEMEDHRDKLMIIFAGYTEEMKQLFKLNPGLRSRVNMQVTFHDYSDEELLDIAKKIAIESHYTLTEEAEKAFIIKISQGKVNPDFANAREVRNIIEASIRERAFRLSGKVISKEEMTILEPMDFGINTNELFDEDFTQLMDELNGLVGLDHVKKQVQSIINYIKVEKMRETNQTRSNPVTMHMVLTGNPGTGKTTVARLYSRILKTIGVIKKGHVVEVTRDDLVGQYVGQTAAKTKEKIKEAYGGVLFIDEAYSLYSSNESDFGYEAISTLIKEMEDNRDKLVVMMAGYTNEMETLLNMNAGIRSRIGRTIKFPDYTQEELIEIFMNLVHQNGFRLSSDASVRLQQVFEQMIEQKDENFGNARTVRSLFEQMKLKQSNRIIDTSGGDLYLIEMEDLLF